MSPKESSLALDEVHAVDAAWDTFVERTELQNTLAFLRNSELANEQVIRIEGKITVSF